MRYFLHLAYQGNRYHGWQNQPNVLSVQEVLEKHLSKLLNQRMTCHGCGRTDAKVHASQYFAHFDFDDLKVDLAYKLNKSLPKDIAIFDVIPVDKNANAQLDATKRTYDYFIHFKKNPFLNDFSTLYEFEKLDLQRMAEASKLFVKYRDYKNFCLSPQSHKSTICEVSESNLFISKDNCQMRFQISSNRFLKGMIRALVGRLLEIGRGKLTLQNLEKALNSSESLPFNKIAYPQGLYLSKVEYPFLNIPTKNNALASVESLFHEDWQEV